MGMTPVIAACFLTAVASAGSTHAQTWDVGSADEHNTITVTRDADGRLTWRVTRDNQTILADSPLGIRRADQAFDSGLTLVSASSTTTIDERYTLPATSRIGSGSIARSCRTRPSFSCSSTSTDAQSREGGRASSRI